MLFKDFKNTLPHNISFPRLAIIAIIIFCITNDSSSLTTQSDESVIVQMKDLFRSAQTDWNRATSGLGFDYYNYAINQFKRFCSDYEQNDNPKINSKLKEQYKIAQNALELIPKQKDTSEYNKAKQNDDTVSYRSYLSNYPTGIFKDAITKKIQIIENDILIAETKAYDRLIEKPTLEACKEFVIQCPNYQHVDKIKIIIKELEAIEKDSIAYRESISQNTSSAYNNYIYNYPTGKYIETAKESLRIIAAKEDSAEYFEAVSQNTILSYDQYISSTLRVNM